MSAMMAFEDVAGVQIEGAGALLQLAHEPTVNSQMASLGAIDAVVLAMFSCPSNVNVQDQVRAHREQCGEGRRRDRDDRPRAWLALTTILRQSRRVPMRFAQTCRTCSFPFLSLVLPDAHCVHEADAQQHQGGPVRRH